MEFAVDDMTCQNCVKHVSEALTERFGKLDFQIDLEHKRLNVTPQGSHPTADEVVATLAEADYTAVPL